MTGRGRRRDATNATSWRAKLPAEMSTGEGTVRESANDWGYRPHLDGLRAVAVYLVVLFHGGLSWFQGGYVGVDLFFVLSGFLVTNVLLADAANGGIRFLRFYARRARRLIPAASVTIVGVSLVALLVSSRLDRANILPDARAASLWWANWHFIASANDYFAEGDLESPLLHFWSLAVEEQFYLVFPMVLFAAIRLFSGRLRRVALLLAGILVAGVIAQLWWASTDPNRAYLGTDARVYQPLAGVLLAVVLWRVRLKGRWQTFGGAAFGGAIVAFLALAVIGPSLDASLRGLAATAVAVLLIFCGETSPGGPVARLLSLKPVRYLGAISYGTYLWHWPVVAFTQRLVEASALAVFILSAVIGTALAALSFELIEQPVRTARWLRSHSGASAAIGLATAVLVGTVLAPMILQRNSRPQVSPLATASFSSGGPRTPVPDLDWTAVKDDVHPVSPCRDPSGSDCVLRSGAGETVFVVGDSHAQMLTPAVLELADRYDWTVYEARILTCPWEAGIYRGEKRAKGPQDCIDRRPLNYEQLARVDPDIVILVGRGMPMNSFDRLGSYDPAYESLSGEALLRQAFDDSIATLQRPGRKILLVEPVPEVPRNPLECLAGAEFVEQCSFPPVFGTVEERLYRDAAAETPNVETVDLDLAICSADCPAMIDGVVVRRDESHLTGSFARTLADNIDAAIQLLR